MRIPRFLLLLPLAAALACSSNSQPADNSTPADPDAPVLSSDTVTGRAGLKTPRNVPATEYAAPAHKPVDPDSVDQ